MCTHLDACLHTSMAYMAYSKSTSVQYPTHDSIRDKQPALTCTCTWSMPIPNVSAAMAAIFVCSPCHVKPRGRVAHMPHACYRQPCLLPRWAQTWPISVPPCETRTVPSV